MKKTKVAKLKIREASRDELDTGKLIEIEGKTYPDYPEIAIAYAHAVADEMIPACRYMILAAKRFLRMYAEGISDRGEFFFSIPHAVEVCAFIETLHHVKGVLAKTTIRLEPWQIWIFVAIYGFRWRDTGDRVVTIAQLEVTRKSGKSLMAAGIALYELGPNAYIGDDLYIIAPTAALAMKVLEPITKMVENNPPLKEYYGITDTAERIDVGKTESYGVILPASGKKQDGHDPKVVIADEFHSLPASIFNVMKSAQGARPESLFLEIGSAGYNAFGVGWDERNGAIEVLEGKRDRPELFAAIYTVDLPGDFGQWENERVIKKCNPNFGISLPKRKMMQEISEIRTNPRNKNEVLRTRFNVWGLGEGKLIGREQWDLCHVKGMKEIDFRGERGWIGVDAASRNDMCCWIAEFEFDNQVMFFAHHYVPEMGPWRDDEEIRDLYEHWHSLGWLTFTPGSNHSYDELFRDIVKFSKRHDLQLVVIDDREANALASALSKKKIKVAIWRKAAATYSAPTKDIVGRSVGKYKTLAHDGNPVLAWNVENTIGAQNTAELILPKKISEHSNMKIDGFDGMVMAHAAYTGQLVTEAPDAPQPMAERGMRVL